MYILYLDDSGSPGNRNEDHFVLAGVALLEPQVHWLTTRLDELAKRVFPDLDPSTVEFHASVIYAGKVEPWKQIRSSSDRKRILLDVLDFLVTAYESATAFGVAIHKPSYQGRDLFEFAFEDLCSRFDQFLQRKRSATSDRHRGLIVLDKSSSEPSLQRLASTFRSQGTRWGQLNNIVEVPLFVDSSASRAIQLADHIAHSVFRRYQAGDTSYLDRIIHRFDQANSVFHGLSHKTLRTPLCTCPACLTRPRR